MKLKIRGQLILSITSIVVIFSLVVGALFLFLFSRITTQLYRSELTTRTTAVADNLNRLLTQEPGTAGGESGGLGLGQAGENPANTPTSCASSPTPRGRSCGSSTRTARPSPPSPTTPPRTRATSPTTAARCWRRCSPGPAPRGWETREDDDLFIPTITVGSPVYGADGALTAAVIMAIQPTGIVDLVRSGARCSSSGMGAALALSVLIAALMARQFTRPCGRWRR